MARKRDGKTPGNSGEPSPDKKSKEGRASAGTGAQRKGLCTNSKGGEKKAKQRQGYAELEAGRGPVLVSTIAKATGMSSKRFKRTAKILNIPLLPMKGATGKSGNTGKPPDAIDRKSTNATIKIYNQGVENAQAKPPVETRPRPTSPPVPTTSVEKRPRPSPSSPAPPPSIYDVGSLANYVGLTSEEIVKCVNKCLIEFVDLSPEISVVVSTGSLVRFTWGQVVEFLQARSRRVTNPGEK